MSEQTGSATILRFPVGGRDGEWALRDAKRPAVVMAPTGAAWAAGESWYHAEAVRDDQQPRH